MGRGRGVRREFFFLFKDHFFYFGGFFGLISPIFLAHFTYFLSYFANSGGNFRGGINFPKVPKNGLVSSDYNFGQIGGEVRPIMEISIFF